MNEDELRVTLIRLLTGVKGKNTNGCQWYTGILEDATDEAEELLKRSG